MTRRQDVSRSFPPDFVSADTLAYRLDYSRSTIDDYVKRGLLPQPIVIGTNPRWHWPQVEEYILVRNGQSGSMYDTEADPFSEGLSRVASSRA